MYTQEGILSTVKLIIEKVREKTSTCEITLDSRFHEDLDINSLDIMSVAVESEKEFEIEISDDEVNELKTVGDIVSCIGKKIKPLA